MNRSRRGAFALGSNLGDRLTQLREAVAAVSGAPGISGVAASALYETDPVGGPDQPSYLNAVLSFDTILEPDELLSLAHECETAAGRVRAEHWGPRSLDVDVLALDDVACDDPRLTLPHPRALERAFVLVPWRDVDPTFVIGGRTVAEWAAQVDASGVRRVNEVLVGAAP